MRHPANPAEDATDESYRLTFGRFGSLSPRTPQSVAITNSHLSKELRVSADGWLVSESKVGLTTSTVRIRSSMPRFIIIYCVGGTLVIQLLSQSTQSSVLR